MGGKTWTAAEEDAFWTEIVPRAAHGRENPSQASFAPFVARMREIGDRERRDYNEQLLYEHWHLNVVQRRFSPNAGNHPLRYIRNNTARMLAQGVTPAERRDPQPGAAQGPQASNNQGPSAQTPSSQGPSVQGPAQLHQTQGQDSDVVLISARHLYGEASENERTSATKLDRFLDKLNHSIEMGNAGSETEPKWVVYFDDQTMANREPAPKPEEEEKEKKWRWRTMTEETQPKVYQIAEQAAQSANRRLREKRRKERQRQLEAEREREAERKREAERRRQEEEAERQREESRHNEREMERLMAEREDLMNRGGQASYQPQIGWGLAPIQAGYPLGGYQPWGPNNGLGGYYGSDPAHYHYGRAPGPFYSGYAPDPSPRGYEEDQQRQWRAWEEFRRQQEEEEARRRQQRREQ